MAMMTSSWKHKEENEITFLKLKLLDQQIRATDINVYKYQQARSTKT